MKRSERHRLKQNEIAASMLHARESVTEHGRGMIVGIALVVVVAAAAAGYFIWRYQTNSRSSELLAKAMVILEAEVVPPGEGLTTPAPTPQPGTYSSDKAKLEAALPRFVEAADAYPTSASGVAARYHAAAILAQLGRPAEAEQRYLEVIERGGASVYAEMSRLGVANVQAQAGRYDEAIRRWQELSTRTDASMPAEGVLLQLGRVYVMAGRTADATTTFNRIVKEFPASQFTPLAREELEALGSATP